LTQYFTAAKETKMSQNLKENIKRNTQRNT